MRPQPAKNQYLVRISQGGLPYLSKLLPHANLQDNFTVPTVRTWYQETCLSASEMPNLGQVLCQRTAVLVSVQPPRCRQ